ncbi:type IV pilus secretin family protein [Thiobacillus sp.]|uniref:type IV pilus secretin family protein n=1 Tax=Thiobacillus sp. TaxID=924 RepID=UPI00181AB77D|nr:type IV pilus secretin family protein [Thiobacillus sp.]MBC2729601.1 type IV pilus secretin PilQ [Thiobacillus sp.]MBC2738336.1 type IV pilus secretin PilQ [Thiobacillus sp.]MBC2761386.1 type IV pilus secretin PilQ [Thiobacillus sp.]
MNALPKIAQKMTRHLFGLILFTGLVLPFAVRAADAPPTGNAVQSVETTTLPGGKIVVRVNLKKALAATPAGFTVGNPPRIALDLPDTGNALGRNTVEANLGPLSSVNVVQAGTRTRLVLNLNKSVEYEASVDGKSLLIALGDVGASAAPVNVSPRFAEAAADGARHTIRDVDFRRGAAGEARVVTTLSDAQAGINIRQQANGVVVDFIGTDLPKALQRRLDVADFGTPVQVVETYTLGDNTRMVIQPKGGWEYSAYQTDNSFIVEVKQSDDAQKKTADGKVKYTGEKLSLNFQNVEVRSVLQVIADFTGLNIVASDTVTGNLTLRLKDVPWDQALDLILQTKGLDKRQNGNVIWIAPKDELMTKEKLEFEAKNQVADLEPLTTEYIQLNYMRADEAQTMLYGFASGAFLNSATNNAVNCSAQAQGLGGAAAAQASQQGQGNNDQKILTKRGRATYELKTNTLIITDTARKIQEIRELLARLDVPARQVMIEARVVIADSNWSRELGVRLGTRLFKDTGRETLGVGGTLNESASIAAGGTPTVTPQVGLGTLGTAAGQIALSILNPNNGNLLSLELSALEADNRGKILSNPRVMTTNQKPAVILNGTQIPFITPGSANSPATVSFKDAFLCLLVDPQILNNDSLIMTVEVQKDAIDTSNAAVGAGINAPAIATRRIKTQVRVNNGETLVLGGIFDQTEFNNVDKVPFLGDVPLLGNLFKRTSKQDQKTELIVFITPRIIDDRLSIR